MSESGMVNISLKQPDEYSDSRVFDVKPLVSVVMLAYQHGRYLAQAIQGVVSQLTGFPFELVIGVDLSSDNTLEVALEQQCRHPSVIRVLAGNRRLGMHQNCHRIFRAIRGRFVAICEGDDYWIDPCKLAVQVNLLDREPSLGGCFHDCYILQENTGEQVARIGGRQIIQDHDFQAIVSEKLISTCSMVFRNCFTAAELEEEIQDLVQIDYMISLLVQQVGPWRYIPRNMGVYRVHKGGLWSGSSSSAVRANNVKFYNQLKGRSRFRAYEGLLDEAERYERNLLSATLAKEGKIIESLSQYLRSFGTFCELKRPRISYWAYWKVLIKALALNGVSEHSPKAHSSR